MIALGILAVLVAICVWLVVRVVRLPKKRDHEREPGSVRSRDEDAAASHAYVNVSRWGGGQGGGL